MISSKCPNILLQGITQIIDSAAGSVQNLAEFRFAMLLRGSLNIVGAVTPAAAPAGQAVTRVDVRFTSFKVGAYALKCRCLFEGCWSLRPQWVMLRVCVKAAALMSCTNLAFFANKLTLFATHTESNPAEET